MTICRSAKTVWPRVRNQMANKSTTICDKTRIRFFMHSAFLLMMLMLFVCGCWFQGTGVKVEGLTYVRDFHRRHSLGIRAANMGNGQWRRNADYYRQSMEEQRLLLLLLIDSLLGESSASFLIWS